MFKKLFSRKKTITKEPKPKAAPIPVQAKSLVEWSSEIEQASGKEKSHLLSGLTEKVQQGEFTLDDTCHHLSGLSLLMFKLQHDQVPDQVSEEQWQDIVVNGFTAKVRKAAAVFIENEETLTALVRKIKGKDKSVYRILHEKLEALHAKEKQVQAGLVKQQAIVDGMKKLADGPFEPMFEAKLKGLIDQWGGLENIMAESLQIFETDKMKAQEKIAQNHAQNVEEVVEVVEEESEPEVEDEVESSEVVLDPNRQPLIDSLVAKLQQTLSLIDTGDFSIAEAQQFLAEVQHQWQESEQNSQASKEEYRAFHKVCTAYEVGLPKLNSLLEKYGNFDAIVEQLNTSGQDMGHLIHDIDDWLHDLEFVIETTIPAPVQHIRDAVIQHKKQLAVHRQQEIDQVRYIRGQLRRCLSAVEEGHLRRASGLYHGIEEKLEGFDLSHHGGIRKQLEETVEALEKLRDWQSYAVLPKKEALIKRMSLLVTQSIDPESRAQTIRDMQDEWKQLSRGLQNRQQDLWETFHELAQQAYEPCKEFFSEQRHLREVNLNQRKEVVEQLNKYNEIVDWENPDIKEVDRVLQVARNDWRKYSPVDRVANKNIQSQFDRLHKSIFDKLRKEQDQFKENKHEIIERAKALLELEDARDATEQAKKLQNEWKTAGLVARKDEQELWKAFRSVCDQLFERREAQVSAFKADLESHREDAEKIVDEMTKIAASKDLLTQQSQFVALRAQYEQIGTLPKSHYQKISKQFRDVCAHFDNASKQAKVAQADQHWQDLIDWVKGARFDDQTVEGLTEQWQQLKVPDVAKTLVSSISDWQERSAAELNQAALHEKTIDLEILTDTESPAEDSRIRMNLQVQRLSDGIGSSTSSSEIDRMVVDWLATGAVEKSAYEVLENRMKLARKTWLQ